MIPNRLPLNTTLFQPEYSINNVKNSRYDTIVKLPEILFITSYPPRECGIATYSQDLINAINNKFHNSFSIKICALENGSEIYDYSVTPKYKLNTSNINSFAATAFRINRDPNISLVVIQHEFGFFSKNEQAFQHFLEALTKPLIIVFHTVLPYPDEKLLAKVQAMVQVATSLIVMTNTSGNILLRDYSTPVDKINVIQHGTHLIPLVNKDELKLKYDLSGRKVLATFGLLSSGKSIETTLEALPGIIKQYPEVMFLIIGKTHPEVFKKEGEQYRNQLTKLVEDLQLSNHVKFVNRYLPLHELLEYLQLTDIYLFTSKDPNQAVSGTFSYALSCGCAVVSTAIPHAKEVLSNDTGIIIDFNNPNQLGDAVLTLLSNEDLRKNISNNALHKMASTSWQNSALGHALLFENASDSSIQLQFSIPPVNYDHIKKMTTDFGMIQFSIINQPDIGSGYTLDDNARALVAFCQHYQHTGDYADIQYIQKYIDFIEFCMQPEGNFLNYVNELYQFTDQNNDTNLDDANGRALWALGYTLSCAELLPQDLNDKVENLINRCLNHIEKMHSTRSMAFSIKGLYYALQYRKNENYKKLSITLADRLVQMYLHESSTSWNWFESSLTYGNSILPEAMLCAWHITQDKSYYNIATTSFNFLLAKIFTDTSIRVISNNGWFKKNEKLSEMPLGGQQPIDVAYTILALYKFYTTTYDKNYYRKIELAFNWFHGLNHLNQIVYNPSTGGCFDGVEENCINLNQGAESTVSYAMARLTIEKLLKEKSYQT